MAALTEKVYRSFIKGLITEANPLTFPENASIDEQNFVLNRDGSRSRRLGIDYEDNYGLKTTGFTAAQLATGRQSFHRWDTPSGDTTVSIGVVRVNDKLWFVDLLTNNPSNNLLNGGSSISLTGLSDSNIETTVINNKLPGHPKDGDFYTIMGIDPAMTGKTAAVMLAYDRRTHMRYVLDVYNMVDPNPQKVRALMEDWVNKYHPQEMRVEINAHQKAYALDEELNQWLTNRGIQFRSHFTGKNKWDVDFGVASMAALFGSDEYCRFVNYYPLYILIELILICLQYS